MTNADLSQAPNFTQIPNAVIDYWLPKLKPTEVVILLILCRKIYGWHKTSDTISANQLCKASGMSKNSVLSALKELESLKLVKKIQSTSQFGWMPNEFRLNVTIPIDTLYVDRALEELKKGREIIEPDSDKNDEGSGSDQGGGSAKSALGVVQNLHLQKKDLTKEKKEKREKKLDATPSATLAILFHEKLKIIFPTFPGLNIEKWAKDLDLLMRNEAKEISQEQILGIIDFALLDKFWQGRIHSPAALRRNFFKISTDKKNNTKSSINDKAINDKQYNINDLMRNNERLAMLIRDRYGKDLLVRPLTGYVSLESRSKPEIGEIKIKYNDSKFNELITNALINFGIEMDKKDFQ